MRSFLLCLERLVQPSPQVQDGAGAICPVCWGLPDTVSRFLLLSRAQWFGDPNWQQGSHPTPPVFPGGGNAGSRLLPARIGCQALSANAELPQFAFEKPNE